MKAAIVASIFSIILFSCGSNKQMSAVEKSSTGKVAKDTNSIERNSVPVCILKMIDSTKKLEPALQLTEIRRYVYDGSRVYLVGMPCCDQFSALYDSACNYLFAPSGGFTGKGDGSHPDFFTVAKEDSLIWKSGK